MARVSVEPRKMKDGGTRWRVRYSLGGERHKETLGTFTRKSDAQKAARKLKVDLENGTFFDGAPGRSKRFEVWCEEWTARSKHRRISTAERDSLALETHWIPRFGPKPLAGITPFDITGAVGELQQTHSIASVRTVVEVLNRCLTSAVQHRLIQTNPCTAVKLSRAPERTEDIRILTADELHRLIGATAERYRIAIALGGIMGLRWSEVAELRMRRVDMLGKRIHVAETLTETVRHELFERQPVKSKDGNRRLPMPDAMVQAMAVHLAVFPCGPDERLVTHPDGGPALRSWFRKSVLLPALKRAELEPVTFHELRHTNAALMIEAGMHPELLRKWLGHADIRTTMKHYARVQDDTFTAAAGALDGVLAARSLH